MTCVRCGYDSRRRERDGDRCPRCGRYFALDGSIHGITDLAFKNAVAAVSESGRLTWTARQLYYELARWARRRSLLSRLLRRPLVRLAWRDFERLVSRWERQHGRLAGLLPQRTFAHAPADDGGAPDVADYAFERIVLCDHETIADLLLANCFHLEHRCPVFTVDGYPEHALERIRQALRREPPKVVVVVHDADPEGCALAERVANDPRWVGGGAVRVVDAGIRPGAAKRFRGLYSPAEPAPAAAAAAVEDELAWLRRYRLDLEVMTPRGLMLAVAAAVATPLEDLAVAAGTAAAAAGVVVVAEPIWWGAAGESDEDYAG